MIPKKYQWVWLLVFSYVYYLAAGPSYLFFILFATTVTYLGGLWAEAGARWAVPAVLLADFGMLAFIKYTNFVLGNINGLFGTNIRELKLLLPLGISFYTFQATGYLLDVHWKRCKAERNPFRFALFLAFFPQIMQGPIGRYSRLADQLYAEREFDMARIERGLYRIVWGFFKKIVIADNAVLYVDAIFDNYNTMPGYGIMGILLYGAQLYADFSGGIDIVIGIAEMLGITLDENFTQPFFATSITDFWHRWHITLGTWMKDYLFYPVSLSRWMGKFGKWARTKFGKNIGRALPICLANIIVFLVVGIWHGPAWHNIFYGLYNGVIIGVSGLLAKNYRDWKKKFGIEKDSRLFYCFQVIRTFILVNISWYLDRAGSTHQALLCPAHRSSLRLPCGAHSQHPARAKNRYSFSSHEEARRHSLPRAVPASYVTRSHRQQTAFTGRVHLCEFLRESSYRSFLSLCSLRSIRILTICWSPTHLRDIKSTRSRPKLSMT